MSVFSRRDAEPQGKILSADLILINSCLIEPYFYPCVYFTRWDPEGYSFCSSLRPCASAGEQKEDVYGNHKPC